MLKKLGELTFSDDTDGLSFCAVLLSLFLFAGVMTARTQQAEAAAAEKTVGTGCVVSAFDGRVAVFPAAGGAPISSTEIRLAGLRECDRELIRRGVPVETYEELLRLVEDLNS